METTATSAAAAIPLPPLAARGVNAPLPSSDDFKRLLATQGISAPESGTPSDAEARIMAAQIAGKANVHAGVKRDRVVAGMNTQTAPIPAPQRFMPLRQGPSAARAFTASPSGSANTVEALRATSKFAPGPVSTTVRAVPAVAQAVKRAPVQLPPALQAQEAAAVPAPGDAEVYRYGLRTASRSQAGEAPAGEPPLWFGSAMENALKKYEAMKAATP